MSRWSAAVLAIAGFIVTAATASSQTRTDEIEQQKDAKAARLQPPTRETGDRLVTTLEHVFTPEPPAIRPTFGDFRSGAGFALGVASDVPVKERGIWTTSTAWSVENFKQVESAIEIAPFTTNNVRLRSFVTWNDAPELDYFGLGSRSALANEVRYGLRTTEVGSELRAHGFRWLNAGVGLGYSSADANDGTGTDPGVSHLGPIEAPGIASSPSWWHTTAYAAIDTRQSPGYTDSGGLYSVRLHDYADRDGAFGFNRTEIDLRQFVPVLHDNWIVALQARADLTSPAKGETVPFFMLPAIGGRDTLPGFTDYRFTDRDSLLLRSELRWTPTPLLNMAVFLDQGTVAPSAGALSMSDLKRGWGVGARIHGDTFTALRLEFAHSVEGWRYNIARGVSF